MQAATKKSGAKDPLSQVANAQAPDIATVSVPDALAALKVNLETGLTSAEANARLKQHGYNEVAEHKKHPVLKFLGKFWGISAWMLELIKILGTPSKYSDLLVVGALLIANAVLSFLLMPKFVRLGAVSCSFAKT